MLKSTRSCLRIDVFFCILLFFWCVDHLDVVWAVLRYLRFMFALEMAHFFFNFGCVAPRTSLRVRGHGSGPSVAFRPFWEPSSTAGAASELGDELTVTRRRADRGNAGFCLAPRTSFRVLGPRRLRQATNNSPGTPGKTNRPTTKKRVFNVSQNPLSGQLGPWGAKKEQKKSHNERS